MLSDRGLIRLIRLSTDKPGLQRCSTSEANTRSWSTESAFLGLRRHRFNQLIVTRGSRPNNEADAVADSPLPFAGGEIRNQATPIAISAITSGAQLIGALPGLRGLSRHGWNLDSRIRVAQTSADFIGYCLRAAPRSDDDRASGSGRQHDADQR